MRLWDTSRALTATSLLALVRGIANRAGGVLDPGAAISLGTAGSLLNAGTLYIAKAGVVGTTILTGDLSSTGKIVFDADFVHGVSDRLTVTGQANIANAIMVHHSGASFCSHAMEARQFATSIRLGGSRVSMRLL